MRWWLFLICAACGRLGFDASAPANDAARDAPGCTFGGWGTPQRLALSDSGLAEESPALTADGLALYFHRYIDGIPDLYVSHRATRGDAFSTDMLLPLNTAAFDRDPTSAADGHHLYFSSDRDTGNGLDELWKSSDLATPVKIAEVPAGLYGPWVREDELELWYTDTHHLFVRTRVAATDPWGSPTTVETAGEAGYSTLSTDRKELLFERPTGPHTATVMVATRTDPTLLVFDNARELTELGTFLSLADPELSRDGTELYFDADDGTSEDLYVTTRSCM